MAELLQQELENQIVYNFIPRPIGRPKKYTDEELIQRKRELAIKYYHENKDKTKEYKVNYYIENRDRLLQYAKYKHLEKQKLNGVKPVGRPKTVDPVEQYEHIKMKAREYYNENKERIKEQKKIYYQEKKRKRKETIEP